MQSYERVCAIVHDVTGVPRDDITAQLHMDALDLCEVVMCVEDEFDILLEDEDRIANIGDLVHLVDAQLAVA